MLSSSVASATSCSHQWWMGVPIAPYANHPLVVSPGVLDAGHSDRYVVGLTARLVGISYLRAADGEHYFPSLSAICAPSLLRCLLKSLAHFLESGCLFSYC